MAVLRGFVGGCVVGGLVGRVITGLSSVLEYNKIGL